MKIKLNLAKTWSYFLTTFLLTVLTINSVQANGWKLAKNNAGVKVYLRHVAGSKIQAFKATTTINASLDSVMAVLSDTKACPMWVYQCKNPLLIQSNSYNKRYIYQVNNLPFPAKDRDLVLYAHTMQQTSSKIITIQLKSVPDFCKDKISAVCKKINASSHIRVRKSVGHYILKPLGANKVAVTWQQYADPAGKLPAWLVNSLVVDIPFHTLNKLKVIVNKTKYKTAKLKYNAQGIAVGFYVKNW